MSAGKLIAVERVAISKIRVGQRRREKLGPIAALARDIEEHGLLHPIIVTDDLELVAGERRLEACKRLGWPSISVRRWGSLSAEEIRSIELAENVQREDLTTFEQSRQMVEAVEEETGEKLEQAAPVSKGGRGKKGGDRARARAAGVDRDKLRRAKKHVTAGEQYPALAKPGWKRSTAIAGAELLDALPAGERGAAAALVDQPGIPPVKAVEILEKLGTKKPAERREIYVLAESEDARDRSLALTKAAEVPPMPDPRLNDFASAIAELKTARKRFPSDRWVDRINEAIELISKLQEEVRQWSMSR